VKEDEAIAALVRDMSSHDLSRMRLRVLVAMERDAREGHPVGREYIQTWATLVRCRALTGQGRTYQEEAPGRVLPFPTCHPVAGKGA
jgi:hypothetical protein